MTSRRTLILLTAALLVPSSAACGGEDTTEAASITTVDEPTTTPSTTSAPETTTTTARDLTLTATASGCQAVGAAAVDEPAGLHLDLAEWSVTPTGAAPDGGRTSVEVTNLGAVGHEVVIVRGASSEELTIPEDSVDLDALPDGATVVGEIKAVAAGATCAATFDLPADDYVFLCNIAHADPGHVERGMLVDLTIA